MTQYQISDGKYNVLFHDITQIEWLDLDLDPESDRLSIAIEVATAIDDWNGQGKIDAYELDGNVEHHPIIYEIWQKLEELREPPKLKVEREGKKLLVTGEGFHCRMKGLTILQYIGVVGEIKRKHSDESQGYFKCLAIAENLIDWNDGGKLTADELYSDRSSHKYLAAVDVALTKFFRKSTNSIRKSITILDGGNGNGRDDDSQPAAVESGNGRLNGIPGDMERVSIS